jgi:hypothetical protein
VEDEAEEKSILSRLTAERNSSKMDAICFWKYRVGSALRCIATQETLFSYCVAVCMLLIESAKVGSQTGAQDCFALPTTAAIFSSDLNYLRKLRSEWPFACTY